MKITKALTRLTGPETAPVFVLLHGWGSNEYDLPDLLNYCGAGSAVMPVCRHPSPMAWDIHGSVRGRMKVCRRGEIIRQAGD